MFSSRSLLVFVSVFGFAYYCTGAASVICVGHCDNVCNCTQNYTFQCADGKCIPLTSWRNHKIDCDDASDEDIDCCPGKFKCDTKNDIGKCLDIELLDNNKTECMDGTDETGNNKKACDTLAARAKTANVPNNMYYYQCKAPKNGSKTGRCVLIDFVLNGSEDCPDGDDEDPANFDECALGLSKCDTNAVCSNIIGGAYKCTCKAGYTGQGGEGECNKL